MKRRDLIKRLQSAGFLFERNGASHDVYKRGNEEVTIPRHREINEILAKEILKKAGA
ncbi:MAG: type II toxin-antitoxin system HicA family toxin [Lachnospiraceae bacterium]|nr:type II toxin-antitoxin system HicA family toxin [Lachnospiraceae bacterium]